MRHIAEQGFKVLLRKRDLKAMAPIECFEVAEFLISQIHSLARNLDMRLLVNCFRDYLQHRDKETQTDWRDLVISELKQLVTAPEARVDRLARERLIALEIAALPDLSAAQREALFVEKTGTSGRGYRRRLQEARR